MFSSIAFWQGNYELPTSQLKDRGEGRLLPRCKGLLSKSHSRSPPTGTELLTSVYGSKGRHTQHVSTHLGAQCSVLLKSSAVSCFDVTPLEKHMGLHPPLLYIPDSSVHHRDRRWSGHGTRKLSTRIFFSLFHDFDRVKQIIRY